VKDKETDKQTQDRRFTLYARHVAGDRKTFRYKFRVRVNDFDFGYFRSL